MRAQADLAAARAELAPEEDSNNDRDYERDDEGGEEEGVHVLPSRQREDVEGEVVAEDRIFGPERHAAERPSEGQPRTRGGKTYDHRGDKGNREAHQQHQPACRRRGQLDDLIVFHGMELRRGAASDGDVPVHDGKEDCRKDDADDDAGSDPRPEDRSEGNFSIPEPVDVEAQIDDQGDNEDYDNSHRDGDEATTTEMTGSTLAWFSPDRPHIVH